MQLKRFTIRAQPAATSDAIGVYRLAAGVLTLCAGAGLMGALVEQGLTRRRRAAALAGMAAGTVLTAGAAARPAWAARALRDHPTASAALGLLPTAVGPAFGLRFNAMHMPAIGFIGLTAAMLGGRRDDKLAALAGAWWVAVCSRDVRSLRQLRGDDKAVMTFVIVPLSMWCVTRLSPTLLLAARELDDLDAKLRRSPEDRRQLAEYGDRLGAALQSVRSALLTTQRQLADVTDPEVRERARDMLIRTAGRLDEHSSALTAGEVGDVEALLRARRDHAAQFLSGGSNGPSIAVVVEPAGLVLQDARVLALLGATASTALSNALRHARAGEIIVRASASGGRIVLTVDNDEIGSGRAPADTAGQGAGLRNLDAQARALGGEPLRSGSRPEGGWSVRLDLPQRTRIKLGRELVSDRIEASLDRALAACGWGMTAAVVGMAAEGHQLDPRHRTRTRWLTAAALAAYHGYELAGGWQLQPAARGPGRSRWPLRALLTASAGVSAVSTHGEHTLWSGWANAVLSRYGLHCSRTELGLLTGAHAVAIVISYRGGVRDALRMASHQLPTAVLGPALLAYAVGRTRTELEDRERELVDDMTRAGQLHDLAESFHSSHPTTQFMRHLQHHLRGIKPAADELNDARRRLRTTARSRPAPLNASAFADEFAGALAARIWPAEVRLERDDATLRRVNPDVTASVVFRREALDVADRLGDDLLDAFPPDRLGRPTVPHTTLQISATPISRTLHVTVLPGGTSAQAPASTDRLASALARIGGQLEGGFRDGRVAFELYGKAEDFAAPPDAAGDGT